MRRLLGALALCVASAKMHDHGPQLEEHEMPVVIVEALDHLIKSSVNTTLPDSLGLHHLPWAPVGSNTSMGDPVAWETKGASADHLVTLDEATHIEQSHMELSKSLIWDTSDCPANTRSCSAPIMGNVTVVGHGVRLSATVLAAINADFTLGKVTGVVGFTAHAVFSCTKHVCNAMGLSSDVNDRPLFGPVHSLRAENVRPSADSPLNGTSTGRMVADEFAVFSAANDGVFVAGKVQLAAVNCAIAAGQHRPEPWEQHYHCPHVPPPAATVHLQTAHAVRALAGVPAAAAVAVVGAVVSALLVVKAASKQRRRRPGPLGSHYASYGST